MEESQEQVQGIEADLDFSGTNDSSLFVTNPVPNASTDIGKSFGNDLKFSEHSSRITSVSDLQQKHSGTFEGTPSRHKYTEIEFDDDLSPKVPTSATSTEPHTNNADESVFSNSSHSSSIEGGLIRYLRRISSESEIEFQNSSFIDNTENQFDLDINLDDCKASRAPDEPSFWLACKSHSPQKLTLGQTHYLALKQIVNKSAVDLNSSSRVAELTKQLTNCKIQLRLYEKFLHDLIDSHNVDSGQLELLHQQWHTQSLSKSSSFADQSESGASPDRDIADISLLVEDLHASLEECQMKWKEADLKANALDEVLRAWSTQIPEFLEALGCEEEIDPNLEPEELLNLALPLLKKAIGSLVAQKLEAVNVESELREQFEKLHLQECAEPTEKNENQISNENHSSNSSSIRQPANQTEDYFLLPPNRGASNESKANQSRIDELEREVNTLKNISRQNSSAEVSGNTADSGGIQSREKLQALQLEHDSLQAKYEELSERFQEMQQSSENKMKSLTNRYNSQKQEILSLRSTAFNFDNVQRDLEVNVEKQRVLTSEKIRLSYQVEALQKDKVSLQYTIDNLTEKLQKATQPNSPQRKINQNSDTNLSSQRFEELFSSDVHYFQKLLTSFNKIADDKSLVETTRKLESIKPYRTKVLSQTPEVINFALGYHSSVSGFFAKAVDVIVKDHIRLLLKQDEDKIKYEARNDQLIQRVAQLEKELQFGKENVLGESQLRIEELTNRWKAEREARVSENKAARRRLNELRQETQHFL